MRHLRSIGFVSLAIVGIGAADASAAPLSPSIAAVSAEGPVQRVGCRNDCGGGRYYRQDYYGSRDYSFRSRGYYYGSRDYYPREFGPRWYGGDYRRPYDYCEPPRVYGVIEERFVILGSGRGFFPRDYRGYLRHW